jgi:diacylglycerol kinase family enzyme
MLAPPMARDFVQSNVIPLLVVANARAGHGRGARRAGELARALQAAGMPFTLVHTNGPGHATALAVDAPGAVVAVGGDGTVHEVVNGLVARARVLGPLAVLPAGSGDDFASHAGFASSPAELVERLRAGRVRQIDVGSAEVDCEYGRLQRRFVNNAGLGFEAEVVVAAANARWLRGRPLYLAATLQAVRHQRLVDCELAYTTAGTTTMTRLPVLFVSTCNGRRVGGGLPFAPDARLDDGQLDVLQVTAPSRRATLVLLWRLLRARHARDARVRLSRCTELAIRPASPMPLAMDGELLARRVTALRLRIDPQRLALLS